MSSDQTENPQPADLFTDAAGVSTVTFGPEVDATSLVYLRRYAAMAVMTYADFGNEEGVKRLHNGLMVKGQPLHLLDRFVASMRARGARTVLGWDVTWGGQLLLYVGDKSEPYAGVYDRAVTELSRV